MPKHRFAASSPHFHLKSHMPKNIQSVCKCNHTFVWVLQHKEMQPLKCLPLNFKGMQAHVFPFKQKCQSSIFAAVNPFLLRAI